MNKFRLSCFAVAFISAMPVQVVSQSLDYHDHVACLGWFLQYIKAAEKYGYSKGFSPDLVERVQSLMPRVASHVLHETDFLNYVDNPSYQLALDAANSSSGRMQRFEQNMESSQYLREVNNLTIETARCEIEFKFLN